MPFLNFFFFKSQALQSFVFVQDCQRQKQTHPAERSVIGEIRCSFSFSRYLFQFLNSIFSKWGQNSSESGCDVYGLSKNFHIRIQKMMAFYYFYYLKPSSQLINAICIWQELIKTASTSNWFKEQYLIKSIRVQV